MADLLERLDAFREAAALPGGACLVLLAIVLIAKQVEVRLVLLLTSLALAALAGDVSLVFRAFFDTFAEGKFLVPICSAMGFAYVLRHTGCDQHLVHLLVQPLTRVRFLLVPGTILVGFLVNLPIVSQTSTAVAIGPVVIPILLAARFHRLVIGSALLLGCSIGGELLNPGAPELRAVIAASQKAAPKFGYEPAAFDTDRSVGRILPLDILALAAATAVFWWMAHRYEKKAAAEESDEGAETRREEGEVADHFRVDPLRALVPIVPLVFLYLASSLVGLIRIPREFLEPPAGTFDTRLIGMAMLLGCLSAALVVPGKRLDTARAFFDGAGYGFTHIISLIVTAQCFGAAIKAIGLAQALGKFLEDDPVLLMIGAAVLPLAFAFLCGSGMASTTSLIGFFIEPAFRLGIDPTHVGAVVSLASAAGRTMSPVAAVTLMSAQLTETRPFDLVRRVAPPLLIGVALATLAAILHLPPP